MGIRFDNSSVDASGVSDRRGMRGPVAIGGGGLGIVGLVVYLLVSVLGGGGGGIDPVVLFPADGSVQGKGERAGDLQTRCNTEGAIEAYDDCFLVKVYNEIDEVWAAEFARTDRQYERPPLTFFTRSVSTACGTASSQVGPFYCPGDRSIYLDIGFLDQLQRELDAQGRYAQAYILAHEAGHHLQTLLGTERRMRAAQRSDPDRENELSVALELQADCYAGVWSKLADDAGNVSVDEAEIVEAQSAAAAVGDDRIQQRSSGRVDPESWTHGSAEQRKQWFLTGRSSGALENCDTFRAG